MPTYEGNKDPWSHLANLILSPFKGDNQRFMKYIQRFSEYQENKECND